MLQGLVSEVLTTYSITFWEIDWSSRLASDSEDY